MFFFVLCKVHEDARMRRCAKFWLWLRRITRASGSGMRIIYLWVIFVRFGYAKKPINIHF